jgi:hypothetical protein
MPTNAQPPLLCYLCFLLLNELAFRASDGFCPTTRARLRVQWAERERFPLAARGWRMMREMAPSLSGWRHAAGGGPPALR